MTLSTATTRQQYAGNGATTSFAFGMKAFAASDFKIYLRDTTTLVDTLQTLTTHYSVSGTLPGTGNIIFVTAPTSSQTVIITRDAAIEQTLDLIASGAFAAENVETALDKIAAFVQSVRDLVLGHLYGNATVDFGSCAVGATVTGSTVTVTGAVVGDFVELAASGSIATTAGIQLYGKVTAADTVTPYLFNGSASTFDAASQSVFAKVKRRLL